MTRGGSSSPRGGAVGDVDVAGLVARSRTARGVLPFGGFRRFHAALRRSYVDVSYAAWLYATPYAHTCHELTVDFAPSVSSRQVFDAPPICSHHNHVEAIRIRAQSAWAVEDC